MAARFREWNIDCKVYIGNLGEGVSKADIENSFAKYGPLRNVWVARNPPGFAFVEFEDGRDAEDACRGLDGTRIAGSRIRAEMSHGRSRRGGGRGAGPPGGGHPGGPPFNYGGGGGGGGGRGGYGGRGGHHGGGGGYHGGYHPGGPGGGYHPGGHHGGRGGHHEKYIDRGAPRERHPIGRPRSPPIKEYRYSRSRSTSRTSQPRAARPRTPPSRSISPAEGRH